MNFLENKDKIERFIKKTDKEGYNLGVSCIGDLYIVLITENEICLNFRLDVEDGEPEPSIIIKSGNVSSDYSVTVLHAESYSLNAVNGYVELTVPSVILPTKSLKETSRGIASYLYQ